jgi:uridine kinase
MTQIPKLIAISGGSCSGKSWLADQLQNSFGDQAVRLNSDRFYFDQSHLTLPQREQLNFDHPRSIDWLYLERTLQNSLAGRATRVPYYDFKNHTRTVESEKWEPKPIILVDGLWLLLRSSVRELFHLKIFIDCPHEARFERRLKRDFSERGRSVPFIEDQFRNTVLPMHDRYVAPQTRWADIVLKQTIKDTDIRKLVTRIKDIIPRKPVPQTTVSRNQLYYDRSTA